MPLIQIDTEKCNSCGICAEIRPGCFKLDNGAAVVLTTEESCSQCGHCLAVCPTGAMEHKALDLAAFAPLGPAERLDKDAFMNFMRQRRSHRAFKDQPIPEDLFEYLIESVRVSPTGSNAQPVEVLIIRDSEKIQRLSELTVDFMVQAIPLLEEFARQAEQGQEIPAQFLPAVNNLPRMRLYRDRLVARQKMGLDPIFYRAPALLVFHAGVGASTPKDDCVIAAQTAVLAARTLGLESCYIGFLEQAARQHLPVALELGLDMSKQSMIAMILGFPKYKFSRTTYRRPIKVRWE